MSSQVLRMRGGPCRPVAPPDSTEIGNIKMKEGLGLDAHCKACLVLQIAFNVIVHDVVQHQSEQDNSCLEHNGQTACICLSLESLVPVNTSGTLKLK